MDDKFKVIEDQTQRTVDKGKNGGGLHDDQAAASADRRNTAATDLGIKTRYSVVPMSAADSAPEALAA